MRRPTRIAALAVATGVLAGALAGPTPASAAHNDSFEAWSTPCDSPWRDPAGVTRFVDYGPGAPGGGNNDDYIEIADQCRDGHGVRGYVWLNGVYLGSRYNGNGVNTRVIWDPFGNLPAGSRVGLRVCLVDGADDTTPFGCSNLISNTLVDG